VVSIHLVKNGVQYRRLANSIRKLAVIFSCSCSSSSCSSCSCSCSCSSSSSFVSQKTNYSLDGLIVQVSRSHTHTYTHTHTHSRTPLDEWSARRRGHYLHNKEKRRTSMSSAGFEPAIPADLLSRANSHRDRLQSNAQTRIFDEINDCQFVSTR